MVCAYRFPRSVAMNCCHYSCHNLNLIWSVYFFKFGRLIPLFPKACNFLTTVPQCQQCWQWPEGEFFFIPKNRYLSLFSSSSFLNYSNQKRSRCETSFTKPQILQQVANRSLLAKLMSPSGSTEDCRTCIRVQFSPSLTLYLSNK